MVEAPEAGSNSDYVMIRYLLLRVTAEKEFCNECALQVTQTETCKIGDHYFCSQTYGKLVTYASTLSNISV